MGIEINNKIEKRNIEDLVKHNDSHNSDMAVEMIKESIEKHGIQQPIIIDKNNNIVAGNAIYEAAKMIGMTEIPVICLDYLSDDEIAQYRIADNKTGEFARWNEEKLKKEISYLDSVGELQFCFDENLAKMLSEKNNIIPNRTPIQTEKDDNRFKESLKKIEEDNHQKPIDYILFVCSNCGKTVTVKK